MSVLVSVDPGPKTGVAVFRDRELIATWLFTRSDGAAAQYQGIADLLRNVRSAGTTVMVVCETFRSRAAGVTASTDGLITARLTGWIEGLALTRGYRFAWIEPAAKRAFTQEAKKFSYGSIHEYDAICLALSWFARYPLEPGVAHAD